MRISWEVETEICGDVRVVTTGNLQTNQVVEATVQPDTFQQNKHNNYQKLQQPNSSEVGENYDKKTGKQTDKPWCRANHAA